MLNSTLTTDNQNCKAEIFKIVADNTKLQQEIEQLKQTATETQLVSQSVPQSKMISFSQIRKNSELQVSGDRKKVVVESGGNGYRNILGEDPLLPGNVYTWKLRYQGSTSDLYVGVIDKSKFSVGGGAGRHHHCYGIGNRIKGCLSGNSAKLNPGELLEINANLINHTLTIKSMSNFSINLTETLPRLSSDNYYPWALLHRSNHVLEIVE
ncbi:hypothetical protein GEMRC1_000895 [Eukaryota sp. GEM-RC1]